MIFAFLFSISNILTGFAIASIILLIVAFWPRKNQTIVERFVQIIYAIAERSFFKEVTIPNVSRIPVDDAVLLVCAPHSNQFVDAIILSHCLNRKVYFMMAASSLKIPVIGKFSQLMNAVITVERPDDYAKVIKGKVTVNGREVIGIDTVFTKEFQPKFMININKQKGFIIEVVDDTHLLLADDFPTVYTEPQSAKSVPHLNQKNLYENCWTAFNNNVCMSIFPEGGSHDRSNFLPFKSGAAQLALGYTAVYPEKRVTIIPVGMNYYQGHKFRRACAFIDIGEPIRYTLEQVTEYKKGGDERKKVVNELMNTISQSLYDVTTTADDWTTLERVNTARRIITHPSIHLNTEDKTKVTRHLIEGFKVFKDDERVQKLAIMVDDYKVMLDCLGINDAYVLKQNEEESKYRSIYKLFYHMFYALIYFITALPGNILGWPIYLYSKTYSLYMQSKALKKSNVKIQAIDVVASNKLVGAFQICLFLLIVEPLILLKYGFTSIDSNNFLYDYFKIMLIIPWFMYYSIVHADNFFENHFRSSLFLLNRIITINNNNYRLMQYREDLRAELNAIIEEKGPVLFGSQDAFDNKRVLINGYPSLHQVKSRLNFNTSAFEDLEDEMLL